MIGLVIICMWEEIMYIDSFKLEDWLSIKHENIQYDIAQTSEDAISLRTLLEIAEISPEEFQNKILDTTLNYGYPLGNPNLRRKIARLYKNIEKDNIVTTHGAIGANHIVIQSLLGSGDHVITIMPAYQQLYSIPESTGAEVSRYFLFHGDNYELKVQDLEKFINPNTKAIFINNPNNPTGQLFDNNILYELVELAKKYDLYIISDEAYRPLNQGEVYSESLADLYEKGVSISTLSKICSIPGVRIGWFATRDNELRDHAIRHREYSTVSCSIIDEYISDIALGVVDKIIKRNVELVSKNLQTLDEIINRCEGLRYVRPGGGTTALIHFDLNLDSFTLAMELLKDVGVYVVPGDTFEIPNSFRVGTTVNPETFKTAMLRIEEYFNKK